MKKDQVKIGRTYTAKVGDRQVTVRIDSTHSRGGWNATNTATGKRIRIKSAQRLRSAAKSTGKTATKTAKSKKAGGERKPERLSALDAAAQVLAEAGKPMRARELITAMAERGLWESPAGKTPHATLYAAMLREARDKGTAARFRKIDRGQFAFCKEGK